jgi:hypothetical protein
VLVARRPSPADYERLEMLHSEEAATVEPLRRVKVLANYRVIHDGTAYSGGDVATVPAALADSWLLNRWAVEE